VAQREAAAPPAEWAGLNANEVAVLEVLASTFDSLPLAVLAEEAFPGNDRGNSWVRNSVRRPLKLGMLVKVGKGTYKLAAPLARAA